VIIGMVELWQLLLCSKGVRMSREFVVKNFLRFLRNWTIYGLALSTIGVSSFWTGLEVWEFLNSRTTLSLPPAPVIGRKMREKTPELIIKENIAHGGLSTEETLALLSLLALIAGLLSYVFHQVVRRDLLEEIQIKSREERDLSLIDGRFVHGAALWATYTASEKRNKRVLEQAIAAVRLAVDTAESLNQEKYARLISRCKNNLVVYLVAQGNDSDKNELYSIAQELYRKRKDGIQGFVSKATWALVLYRFFKADPVSKLEAYRLINEILNDAGTPVDRREHLKETWAYIFEQDFEEIWKDLQPGQNNI
jgi:hypothetical protein